MDAIGRFNPAHQLELLSEKTKTLAPGLYRTHALYLQILRKLLVKATNQAIFNIITENNYRSLSILSVETRDSLRKKIDHLVSSCSSLLTIEHLLELASEMENDKREAIEKVKDQFLNSIL